ncbi:MAG: AMP-binding protein [Halioglobus sp.]|nr:AMP-binding protein [Halioglobus sp.]
MPAPPPRCSTLQQILSRQAELQPAAPALIWQGEAISYQALHARAVSIARKLAADGEPGDRIAVLSFNSPEFVALVYAVAAAGQVLVPLNARLAPAEWTYQLCHTGSRRLFAQPQLLQRLAQQPDAPAGIDTVALDDDFAHWPAAAPDYPLPDVEATDAAWILYTSGSTGRPKGAVLTHGGFMAGLASAALARPVLPGDRYFYPFPLFHVAAHNVLLQHLHGAAVVLAPSFDATQALDACRSQGVTSMSLAPTMIAMLLEQPGFHPDDLAGVRTIGYGASAMPAGLLQRLLDETRVGLCQSYGMTELCGSVAFLTVEDHVAARQQPRLLQSVGRPLPTAEVMIDGGTGFTQRVGVSGEIVVRAAQCMAGYWRDQEASASALRDGWLYTGDIGRFDDNGYLYIVDRKKDMIISGGENIASREVEEVLREHPAVRDCAVIGLPDERWGEMLCAAVQLVTSVDDEALAEHCRERLARYKTPRRWFRVEALPLNASGKVDKPRLRRQFGD